MQREIAELRESNKQLSEKLAKESASYASEIRAIHALQTAQFKRVEEVNSGLRDALSMLTQQLSSSKIINERVANHGASLRAITERVANHGASLRAINERVANHGGSLREINEHVIRHRDSLNGLNVRLNKQTDSLASLNLGFKQRAVDIKDMQELLRKNLIIWDKPLAPNVLQRFREILKNRIVTRLDGGLASQMWQFAQAYAVHRELGFPLYIEVSWFENSGLDIKGNRNRFFLLLDTFPAIREKFGNHLIHSDNDIKYFRQIYSDNSQTHPAWEYIEELFYAPHSRYMNKYNSGFCFVEKYREELIKLFRYDVELNDEERKLESKIKSSNSCAIHVRRGDFLNSKFDVCTDSYYLRAVERMLELHEDVQFFVFTNDEPYVEILFADSPVRERITVVTGRNEEDPRVDMYLISICRNIIMSNSGFSAYPTYFSSIQNKTVIRPEFWRSGEEKEFTKDCYMLEGWIKLPLE